MQCPVCHNEVSSQSAFCSSCGAPLAAAGKTAVIPPRANRSSLRDYDRPLYGERHLIETFFAKIKQFRAIATRYEKTARNFLAAVQLVASVVWLN